MGHVVCVFLHVSFLVFHLPNVCNFHTLYLRSCVFLAGLSSLLEERPLRLLLSSSPRLFRCLFLGLLVPELRLSRPTSLSSLPSNETLVTDGIDRGLSSCCAWSSAFGSTSLAMLYLAHPKGGCLSQRIDLFFHLNHVWSGFITAMQGLARV